MKQGIIVNEKDIKKILAKYFGVQESEIMRTKYSYVIQKEEILEQEKEKNVNIR